MATLSVPAEIPKRARAYIIGYGMLGAMSVPVSHSIPGASSFFFGAILLAELGRFCLQMRQTANAFRTDIRAIAEKRPPNALVEHVRAKKEGVARWNEASRILLWFSGIVALGFALIALPMVVSASLMVWPILGMFVYLLVRSAGNRALLRKFIKASEDARAKA